MNLKYCNIDPEDSSIDEIKQEIIRLKKIKDDNENLQMALKIFINSAYGAIGNQYFQCYNTDVAEAITTQGQDLLMYAIDSINKYFKEEWHLDVELHDKIGIRVLHQLTGNAVKYGDTDSVNFDTLINISNDIKLPVWFIWEEFSKLEGFIIDSFGHEIVQNTSFKVLNYTKSNDIKEVEVSKIIRHKVNKSKWKLKTKSGKEIIMTNDHSMIVFRDGEKLEVKPCEILKTDKILVLK